MRTILTTTVILALTNCIDWRLPQVRELDADTDADEAVFDGDLEGLDGDGEEAEEPVCTPTDEVCDGLDNDCDGEIDLPLPADATLWYRDDDGDGFGALASGEPVRACRWPGASWSGNDDDCDDQDEAVNPSAEEVACDGLDNDCDDEIDPDLGANEDCPALSCLDLHDQRPGLPSGAYWTLQEEEPTFVYCDMETGSGGWTALINPVDPRLSGTHPALEYTVEVVDGTEWPGESIPRLFIVDGWRGVRVYVSNNATVRLTLRSSGFSATDVMFLATIQGQERHTVVVNEIDVPPDALTDAYMQCAFWNSDGDLAYPEANECWSTTLDAAPHMELGVLNGDTMELILEAGPSCSPDCLHGTGLNVTRLFVR